MNPSLRPRLILTSGFLLAAMGAGGLVPVTMDWLTFDKLSEPGRYVLGTCLGMILIGLLVAGWAWRRPVQSPMPKPVRAGVAINIVFLAFFALELNDGIVRQEGRVFYWTSVLFLPALVLLFGLVAGHRWAWWVARGTACLLALWFLVFIAMVPFADLRSDGVLIPWYGRIYVVTVSLAFAALCFYAFRVMGSPASRRYFGASV